MADEPSRPHRDRAQSLLPLDLAMRLLPTLGSGVLKEISEDAGLALPVREAIAIELEAREQAA